jgi:DNA-binding CsgD family transcriptional regulator
LLDEAFERRGMKPARSSPLTSRQRQVLQLLAEGFSMKQVAAQLGVTPRTVAFHKYRIMEEHHLVTNTELLRFSIDQGLCGKTLKPAFDWSEFPSVPVETASLARRGNLIQRCGIARFLLVQSVRRDHHPRISAAFEQPLTFGLSDKLDGVLPFSYFVQAHELPEMERRANHRHRDPAFYVFALVMFRTFSLPFLYLSMPVPSLAQTQSMWDGLSFLTVSRSSALLV